MKKTIDCSDLIGTYTLNEMPELLNKLQGKIDSVKGKKKEKIKYLQIRIYKNGNVKSVRSNKSAFDLYGKDLYSSYNRITKTEYDFFITTNFNIRKDCKRHFNKMLKALESEQKILNRKIDHINKIISNTKEL